MVIWRSKLILSSLFCLFLLHVFIAEAQNETKTTNSKALFHVGVILDSGTVLGKMGKTSISMAVDDFYDVHRYYSTRLALHYRDSNNDAVQASFQALDLLKNVPVQAIIGPQKSQQASFLIDLGNKTQVPIVSFSASSPTLSSSENPYFIRTTPNDSAQVKAICDIVKEFGWRQAILVYENTEYGRGIVPYIVDALQAVDVKVSYRSVLSPTKTDDDGVMEELYKMKTMGTRVFIVHMSAQMGARLFLRAKDAGMMSEGYSWILTDSLSNMVDSLNPLTIEAMQGVLGVRLHMPKPSELEDFCVRWKRRFRKDHPSDEPPELSVHALLAYDTAWSLAMSVEEVRAENSSFQKESIGSETMPISNIGPNLLRAILANNFNGVSGRFLLVDGQSQSSTFEIVNVVGRGARVIGYWTPTCSLSRSLDCNSSSTHTGSNLNPIIWPGESYVVPQGWEIPTTGKKLRIGTPVKPGFPEFIDITIDKVTNATTVKGYNIDVFEAATRKLQFDSYEYFPFVNAKGEMAGTYDELIYQVYLQKYDAVVGDTTIRANRTKYVDFTVPYGESGVSLIVPVRESRRDGWAFAKPLSSELWLAILVFIFSTGLVVWARERSINPELTPNEQLEIVLFLPTLIFAHQEKLKSFASKIVVVVWVFVLIILTQSYTANLTSLLTVDQLEPAISSLSDLKKNDLFVGHLRGSFARDLLLQLGFDKSKLRSYVYPDEFVEALKNGSEGGGVSAIVHEIPYIKSFLAKHPVGFTMVGPVYECEGFGFVFPKGSPLVPEISRALLEVIEGDEIKEIQQKWFGNADDSINQQSKATTNILYLRSLLELFIILGVVLLVTLFYTLIMFLYQKWDLLEAGSIPSIFRRQGGARVHNNGARSNEEANRELEVPSEKNVVISTESKEL